MRFVGLRLPDEPKFICPDCGKEYKSEAALKKHMEKEHPDNQAPNGDADQE